MRHVRNLKRMCWFVLVSLMVVGTCVEAYAQNQTDVSLFMREMPGRQIATCESKSGDMYKTLGHHGPAVENAFFAVRLFFDKKGAVDVYSKTRPGLELKQAAWYPTPQQQADGFGGDYYHVGDTVGLGGVRLWDGRQVLRLDPVSRRLGRVEKTRNASRLEIRSVGVPYNKGKVDVTVRITVFDGQRHAKVEAFTSDDTPVQFVTGLNHRKHAKMVEDKGVLASWGGATGGVGSGEIEVGAAVMVDPADFVKAKNQKTQSLLISKPTSKLTYWITSANSKESDLNTFERFRAYVVDCQKKVTRTAVD